MTLEWQDKRTDSRGCYSKCNRYSVCSTGEGSDERWTAWKVVPGGAWFAPLACGLMTEDEARSIAERDAETAIV